MSGIVCVFCPKTDAEKLKNMHVDLAFSMRSYPPQYPRSSTPLNPPPSLFLFFLFLFFLPPFSSHFPPSFPPSLFVLSLFLLSFFPGPPSFFSSLSTSFLCVCVCVCISRLFVRAYLAIPCVSANDNVKHTKSNIRYDNKINNMK